MKFNLKTPGLELAEFARRLRKFVRFRAINPGRYCIEVAYMAMAGGKRYPIGNQKIRVLLVSDGAAMTSQEQFYPFSAYRRELRKNLQLCSVHLLLKDVLLAPGFVLPHFDVIGLKMTTHAALADVVRVVGLIKNFAGNRPIVYFDGEDDICVQWPEMLSQVDLYVKKHVFGDRTRYLEHYIGKSNLTDFVHRRYGYSFADNVHVTESRPVASDQLQKIILGGNLALDRNIMELYAKRRKSSTLLPKNVDIMFRGNVPKDWLYYLRKDIEPSLTRLQKTYRVIMPRNRVDREEYYREMMGSKICISPFGYGEICWRDFEAVVCGSLLVKPDMSHVETTPDIFRPHETYVPVQWDYADLEDKCSYYLNHPNERERIVASAFKVLEDFYGNLGFARILSELLEKCRR